jgi:hypothetical protein
MITTEILEACLERLRDFDYSPPIPVAWPGVDLDPPEEGVWLDALNFPNQPRDLAWGDDSCHDTFGFFQVRVFFRPGVGQVVPSTIADLLIAFFPKGLALGPVRVRQRPWQSPLVTMPDKLYIPVTIPWRGITEVM